MCAPQGNHGQISIHVRDAQRPEPARLKVLGSYASRNLHPIYTLSPFSLSISTLSLVPMEFHDEGTIVIFADLAFPSVVREGTVGMRHLRRPNPRRSYRHEEIGDEDACYTADSCNNKGPPAPRHPKLKCIASEERRTYLFPR